MACFGCDSQRSPSVAFVAFRVYRSRQIQRDECKPGPAVLRVVESHDVLMAFGACLELKAAFAEAILLAVHVHLRLITLAAEAFRRGGWSADCNVPFACNNVAITVESFLIEGGHLVLRVGGGVGDGADAKLPFAEAHMDIGRLVL